MTHEEFINGVVGNLDGTGQILLCLSKEDNDVQEGELRWIGMLADIDAGLISAVIVKDMSRFGRNYLEVGLYTEIHFPEKGVRFIAVNSNVDSDNPTENEFTPFLNVINEWYAKDTSRKICAIFKSRMSEGLRCSGSVPYGWWLTLHRLRILTRTTCIPRGPS